MLVSRYSCSVANTSAMDCLSCSSPPSVFVIEGINSFCLCDLMPLIRFKALYSSSMCSISARLVNRFIARISLRICLLSLLLVVESELGVSRRCCMSSDSLSLCGCLMRLVVKLVWCSCCKVVLITASICSHFESSWAVVRMSSSLLVSCR